MERNGEELGHYMSLEDTNKEAANYYENYMLKDAPGKQKVDNAGLYEDPTNERLARDLKRVKKWLLCLTSLLIILFVAFLIAAVVAALAYTSSLHVTQSDASSSELANNSLMQQIFMQNFSFLSEEMLSLQKNLSSIAEKVDNFTHQLMNDIETARNEISILNVSASRNITTMKKEIADLIGATSRNNSILTSQFNDLDSELNADLEALRSQISSLQNSVSSGINSVRSEVRDLQVTASRNSSMLAARIDAVRNQVTGIQQVTSSTISSVNGVNSTLLSVQSQLHTFMTTVNSQLTTPINLYQNCYQDTESCTVEVGAAQEYYKPWCHTPWQSVNVTVS